MELEMPEKDKGEWSTEKLLKEFQKSWRLNWKLVLNCQWVLQRKILETKHVKIQLLSKHSNLNDGIGNACAGQINATWFCSYLVILLELRSSENLGLALPIGSEIIVFKTNMSQIQFTNLNAGMGEPWAGQTKVTADPSTLLMLFELTSSENLGLVLPMGSKTSVVNEVCLTTIDLSRLTWMPEEDIPAPDKAMLLEFFQAWWCP